MSQTITTETPIAGVVWAVRRWRAYQIDRWREASG
jgi:hypothetical protein